MLNFEIQNPTQIIFGQDQWGKLQEYIRKFYSGTNILIAYGGGSIEQNGILQKVKSALSTYKLYEFKGIEANPQYLTLMKAVSMIHEHEIGFILAVGGGSVIDGVKFISGAVHYQGDPWEVLDRVPNKVFGEAMPFGTVLTLPATGSEANSGAVISRQEMKEKRTMGGPQFFPKFSLLDPTVVASLPKRQIANGVTDAFVHVLEQYLTHPTGNRLQERQAEAVLSTLIEIALPLMENPTNYELAANLMWCATHALNGNLRCGVPTDWATHMIGHELTALYGIDHARTLAIIAPRLYEQKFSNKQQKLTQYGKRVWQLTGTDEEIAHEAIRKTESFFQSMDIATRIRAYTHEGEAAPAIIRQKFEQRGWMELGERKDINPEEAERIVKSAL